MTNFDESVESNDVRPNLSQNFCEELRSEELREDIREDTSREQAAFLRLEAVAADFLALRDRFSMDEAANQHRVIAAVHAMLASIVDLEQLGVDKDRIHAIVAPVRTMHAESPLITRMQAWPRGYAGDYETVEMLLAGQCVSEIGTLPYYLERYLLDCTATQQHRNKVTVQANMIRSAIRNNPEAAILMVACGGCPDLRLLLDDFKTFRGQLWLNDIDGGALEYSARTIAPAWPQVKTVRGNVVELVRDAKSLPRFDLIVAGGLYDYLEDRVVRFVTKGAYSVLKPNGTFFFTNIGRNPYRPWMEYCGEWFLRERDAADLRRLVVRSGVLAENIRLSMDTTGLAHLVEISN